MTTNNHPAHGPVSLDRLHQIREHLQHDTQYSNGGNRAYILADVLKVIDGAIASSSMEPYGYVHKGIYENNGSSGLSNDHEAYRNSRTHIPLYTAPPAQLVNTIDETLIEALRLVQCMLDDYRERNYGHAQEWIRHISAKMDDYSEQHGDDAYSVISAAMLQAGNFREISNSSTSNCREISETSTNEYGIETNALLKHIEGMEVSVDVSTCDADAGHRYFGTVTEISELDTAKNGYILLVQDAKPNFKQAGNSPAVQDCWCRTCRPVTMNDMRFVVCPDCGNKRCPRANDHRNDCTGSNEPGQEGSAYPAAPQQEVKSAIEHGMQRYAVAMQKLSEGDK